MCVWGGILRNNKCRALEMWVFKVGVAKDNTGVALLDIHSPEVLERIVLFCYLSKELGIFIQYFSQFLPCFVFPDIH